MGSYFGSKATSGLCQPIIALMPPHDTYIETHLGGGAIMKRKPPALHNIGIDLNPRALAAFAYLHHTRTSGRRYRFDYEEQDHIELLELLKTLPCNIILSGYPSALYDERLAGWRTLELQVMNHAGVRTEKLWFNFTPDRVHWASCAGRNFTDRQRIKRRAANWGKNYRALPREERLAVLAAMMAVEAEDAAGSG
ncbi:DNA methylase [Thiolapillus sp.]|nr:DNA methylase [Thiolapillus sp.]